MNCLCCGKPMKNPSESGWHANCIKRFFGTRILPEIDLSDSTLEQIAQHSVHKGLTVPGVQKKLSLHLFSDPKQPRLTFVDYPTGYILKPPVKEYPNMPEAEHLIMSMADACGIKTVPHALIRSKHGYSYITRRVDRVFHKVQIEKLAMEDFCQLEQRLTRDKYLGSYERCSQVVSQYSSQNALDQTELFLRLVFCFLTGNSDMHLKNFSLLETEVGSGTYVLSPAYDLLPVNLILPEDQEQMALTLNGKKRNIRRKDFLIFAEHSGIKKETAERMLTFLLKKEPELVRLCDTSLLPENMKSDLATLIHDRCSSLS